MVEYYWLVNGLETVCGGISDVAEDIFEELVTLYWFTTEDEITLSSDVPK